MGFCVGEPGTPNLGAICLGACVKEPRKPNLVQRVWDFRNSSGHHPTKTDIIISPVARLTNQDESSEGGIRSEMWHFFVQILP